MRITHTMLADTTVRNLATNMARMEGYSNELTSGRRLHRPSDDPVAVTTVLAHRATLEEIEQHLKNIDDAQAWLEVTDSALDSTGQVVHRAYELAVAAASDTLTAQDRAAIQSEIDALIEQVVQFANATYGDQYVFSGSMTTTPAYTAGTPPVYNGNMIGFARSMSPDANIAVNITGPAAFAPIFAAMDGLRTALGANDAAGIETAIGDLHSAQDNFLTVRAQVGARTNRLISQRERLTGVQVNVSGLRSKLEDTDYASTLVNFSTAETVYKAALQVGARSVQPSLMDYLR
jgi:flagellar hook-associated protein 3 FlgL